MTHTLSEVASEYRVAPETLRRIAYRVDEAAALMGVHPETVGRTWDPQRTGPRPSDKLTPYEDIADPANGNRVPRCKVCGYPKRPGIAVLDFGLTFRGKAAGHVRLCERCWMEENPPDPRLGDPLDVTAA